MSETPSSPSNLPIIAALSCTGIFVLATQLFPLIIFVNKYLRPAIRVLQIFTVIMYSLIIAKFSADSGLIRNYNPKKGTAEIIGSYGGPIWGLVGEIIQIVTYLQLGMLLMLGITFQRWSHGFATDGPNYWLLTILAILILLKALLDLTSRTNDLRYYWSDLAKIVDEHPEITEQDEE